MKFSRQQNSPHLSNSSVSFVSSDNVIMYVIVWKISAGFSFRTNLGYLWIYDFSSLKNKNKNQSDILIMSKENTCFWLAGRRTVYPTVIGQRFHHTSVFAMTIFEM